MRQSSAGKSAYSVRAALRVLDILDVLQHAPDGVSLGEVAEAAGLPKSSAFRYLATLESRRYVERDLATGNYRLGLALLPSRPMHLEILAVRARPFLTELRDRFQETLNLGVMDGNRVAYLEILESPRTMRLAARKGHQDPIHSTALGKALASQLSDEEVRGILAAEGMPQLTRRTITDPDQFLEVVEEVRRRGFAVDDGENEEDGRCVAVPVPGGRMHSAISLSAPAVRLRLRDVEKVGQALRQAAGRVAEELGATDA